MAVSGTSVGTTAVPLASRSRMRHAPPSGAARSLPFNIPHHAAAGPEATGPKAELRHASAVELSAAHAAPDGNSYRSIEAGSISML